MDKFSRIPRSLPRFLNIDLFAETFGFPKATVRRWVQTKAPHIPRVSKIGHKNFFALADVIEWERQHFFTRKARDLPHLHIPAEERGKKKVA